ncbi:tetratricopeptide repeat protein [bacterium]|nr:tetratricopeptide repeat protein [bacterium]
MMRMRRRWITLDGQLPFNQVKNQDRILDISWGITGRSLIAGLLCLQLGCTTMAGPKDVNDPIVNGISISDTSEELSIVPASQEEETQPDEVAKPIVQTSAEEVISAPNEPSFTERGQELLQKFTGQNAPSENNAKDLYRDADKAFRDAAKQSRESSVSQFKKAAELFEAAGDAAPGSALQQDAMFMQGESLFFADQLVEASDAYENLQKSFPRNRHIDKVASRLFSISRYWIDIAKTEQGKWIPINLTDPSRPRLDLDGHAIRVLDQIRYDDPTGRLADDATMAAAAEYIRQEKYQEADEFLTDLRETFPDSEHLFLAHLMGTNVKLKNYRGTKYSGLDLEEAEELVQKTRQRFPDKLASNENDFGQRLEQSAAKIAFYQAERLRYRAQYREKRKEFGAARYYYQLLLTRFPDTPHAEVARERLAATEKKPRLPAQRLSWLTTIFPDSTAPEAPLELNSAPTGESSTSTILR